MTITISEITHGMAICQLVQCYTVQNKQTNNLGQQYVGMSLNLKKNLHFTLTKLAASESTKRDSSLFVFTLWTTKRTIIIVMLAERTAGDVFCCHFTYKAKTGNKESSSNSSCYPRQLYTLCNSCWVPVLAGCLRTKYAVLIKFMRDA